ncbi:MAG: hypothetical protein JNK60_03310 [Acidobacteria bacterium]|nr:hypothetical protein [Acidobacteriota bacterium]
MKKGKPSRPVCATKPRPQRERPTPRWLKTSELDDMARRRCLMILSVLSGTTPVSQAIVEADISRATYYQLEARAMKAMLQALMPGAEGAGGGEPLSQQMTRMEKSIAKLQKEKRRAERLLYLTRQIVKPGPMTSGKGPKRNKTRPSTKRGPRPSTTPRRTQTSPSPPPAPSTPMAAGTVAR